MTVAERFIKYVKIHSASREDAESTPTSPVQLDFARILEEEMRMLGLEEVYCDENAYVYGALPASPGYEDRPAIGFIAHLDTIPDFPGENVKPQIIENYDGGTVKLGDSGLILSPEKQPHLPALAGQTLITTDGSTVLGADDKAGIAAILSACETVIKEKRPHGRIAVVFTPDEEVGHGASLLDIDRLGVDFAYTVDGGEASEINFENFNAASASWEIKGVPVHPGSAKDTMVNASLVAMEINSMLPSGDIPARTEGYEGFFHLTHMEGGVDAASLSYIIRDHDSAKFEMRKETMRHIEALINQKYGEGTAKLSTKEQYRNMSEMLADKPHIVSLAERAIEKLGRVPERVPIRGGTDGSQLSFRGLPCPNLGSGCYAGHGPYEHTTAEILEEITQLVLNVVELNIE